MLNRFPRYHPLLDFLSENPVESILEVGSGPRGLGEFLAVPFVGCDLGFGGEPAPEGMMRVYSRGESLPFADGAFDLVVCQDTVEHVPPEVRPALVRELLRVSRRHVYLSFPRGELAFFADRVYAAYHCRIRKFPVPEWYLDHRRIPRVKVEEVEAVLRAEGVEFRRWSKENLVPHVLLIMVEHWPWLNRRLLSLLERHPRGARRVARVLDLPPTYRVVYRIEKRK